jgi:hypothetical protein
MRLWLNQALARMEAGDVLAFDQFDFQVLRNETRQILSDGPEIARIRFGVGSNYEF